MWERERREREGVRECCASLIRERVIRKQRVVLYSKSLPFKLLASFADLWGREREGERREKVAFGLGILKSTIAALRTVAGTINKMQ